MSQVEIKALIKLLDDSDPEIFNHIEEQLMLMGKSVIPDLENAWSGSIDAMMQQRIENIIHKIQIEDLQRDLSVWVQTGCTDLLKGVMYIARYQYPDLDEAAVMATIEKLKRDAWLEMNENLTALEQIKVLNRIFFEIHGFSGNTKNYHAPQNSFLNIVLETRKGNPLMLSILYMEVARHAGIPLCGINLPEHFILGYEDDTFTDEKGQKILFYVNPFSKGDIFGRKEIERFLKQLKIKEDTSYFTGCSNLDMIQRLLRNLSNSFQKAGYEEKVQEVYLLLKATQQ